MKTFLTLLFLLFLISAFAQEKRIDKTLIPEQIKTYLQLHYSSAKEIDYFKKKDKDSVFYEVEVDLNKQEYNLRFSLLGNLLETERVIAFNELQPSLQQKLKSALNETFRQLKITKTQEVNQVGTHQYEVYVKVRKSNKFKGRFYKVMFDGSGKLLSIEEDKLFSIESVF